MYTICVRFIIFNFYFYFFLSLVLIPSSLGNINNLEAYVLPRPSIIAHRRPVVVILGMTPRVHHAVVTRGASEVFTTWPETRAARGEAGVLLVRRPITPIDIASCSKSTIFLISVLPLLRSKVCRDVPRNMATMLGRSVPGGSSGPASSNKTFHSGCSLSLDATTEPAVPPKKEKRVTERFITKSKQ